MEGSRSKWSARCTSTNVPSVDWYHHWRNWSISFGEERTQTTTRQTSKFTKSKYFVTLTCSHGGVKVKMKCMLHIYIVSSVDWYHHWRNRSSSFGRERTQTTARQTSKFTKSKYFVTLTCSHGEVKVKMKCMLHIYIVSSVDWYHHWRNQLSSFGGEANYYPISKNNLWRTDGRTDTLITIWHPFGAISGAIIMPLNVE